MTGWSAGNAEQFLLSRINYERQSAVPYRQSHYKLDRMHELLRRLGRPDQGQRIIHIAGTKGKGSTAAMIAAILSAAGYRTGVFSSPHLERVEERFAVDGQPCSPAELSQLVERVRPVVAAMDEEAARGQASARGPTYFEITTAMALLHFARRSVEATVLEVGMGGRLDSTNVCQPLLSIITSISFDHTEQLGNTLAAIAGEKAGIIKPGVPVVSGVVDDEPRDVIRRVAAAQASELIERGADFDFRYVPPEALDRSDGRGCVDFIWRRAAARQTNGLWLGLLGRHQAANAATALAGIEILRLSGWKIGESAVRHGLATARCPARVEIVARRPTVIVDAAHNVAAAEALAATLAESFAARRRVLVFAGTKLKDLAGILQQLAPLFEQVVLTRYRNNPRAEPPERLAPIARQFTAAPVHVCDDAAQAWEVARGLATDDGLICVTGSFFMAAELRSMLQAPCANPSNHDG